MTVFLLLEQEDRALLLVEEERGDKVFTLMHVCVRPTTLILVSPVLVIAFKKTLAQRSLLVLAVALLLLLSLSLSLSLSLLLLLLLSSLSLFSLSSLRFALIISFLRLCVMRTAGSDG